MDKIRVLLANHPVMVPDAIRELVAEQEDMEVVGDCRGPMKILQEAGRVNADAVILGQAGTEDLGLCSHLLAVYPDITILSVAPDLASAYVRQLHSHRWEFTGLQGQDLVRSLRAVVREPCTERKH